MSEHTRRRLTSWTLYVLAVSTIVVVARWSRSPSVAPAQAGRGTSSLPSEAVVNEALGLEASVVAALAFEGARAGAFTVIVPIDGRLRTLELLAHSVRAEHYRVKVQQADGTFVFADPQPVRTYRGHVKGDPGSSVAASFADDGLHARILTADGGELWVEPVPNPRPGAPANAHAIYRGEDVIPTAGRCDAHDALRQEAVTASATAEAGSACGSGLCIAEVGVDTDVEYFLSWGSVAAVEDRINSVINAMNLQYETEVGIRHAITTIIVRTAEPDPYSATEALDILYEFRAEWINNQGSVQRDTAELFTGKAIAGSVIGIAWLNAICSSYGYSVVESDFNGNFSCATDLSAHELGHNWGAGHCDCASPGYTMNPYITCANQFQPSLTIPDIIAFRDGRSCLSGGATCLSDADCNDALFCTGVETCVGGLCQTSGDPCPGEDCDEPSATCVPPICNNDGTCQGDEDCDNCPNDCFATSGNVCGNGVCETGAGEDCVNCPQDCNGVQNGKPSGRYCCGNGGVNPISCSDSRCTAGGGQCTDSPGTPSCCGDGVCQGTEDAANCTIDCAVSCAVDADCDDADACTVDVCQGGLCSYNALSCDDSNACTFDSCVAGTCLFDAVTCDDGDPCSDDQCDAVNGCTFVFPACGPSDGCCGPDCTATDDLDCSCGPKNASCATGGDCCSGNCKPNGRCR